MSSRSVTSIAAVLAVVLAFAGGWWLRGGARDAGSLAPSGSDTRQAEMEPETEPDVLYWYDPMYPDKHFDAPGPSPFMDMQLVPKFADGERAGSVRIDPATVQNLGVRTALVERGTLDAQLSVPGTIAWDLRREHRVSARTAGVLERLHVRAPFEPVHRGEPLATLLAPDWASAIAEYRALRDGASADAHALLEAARARLRALGMDEAQIHALDGSGSTASVLLRAPVDGVISTIEAREGQQLMPGAPVMTVNGLDTVWVEAAVPQAQAAAVRSGVAVEASVDSLPGRVFEGHVEALLPSVEAATRTQTARIVLDNPERLLAPGMFAQVRIEGGTGDVRPLVPDEALIATGEDTRVIVAAGNGRFRPVRVRTGRSAGGMTEVLAGLEGGERIVVSGQFLIDSEASLRGALERIADPERADPSTAQGHEEHPAGEDSGGHEGHRP